MPLETINYFLALAVLVLQVLTVGLLAAFFLRNKIANLSGIADFLSKWGLWIAFALSLAASALTLFYSDVLGIAACIVCWWQRICLYPLVVVLGVAAWKKERTVAAISSIALSIIGGAIAFYQHLLQVGITTAAPCDAIPGTDCAQRFIFEFGYITLPLMAVSVFAALIVLMLFVRGRSNR